jgi:hypothetical protein
MQCAMCAVIDERERECCCGKDKKDVGTYVGVTGK